MSTRAFFCSELGKKTYDKARQAGKGQRGSVKENGKESGTVSSTGDNNTPVPERDWSRADQSGNLGRKADRSIWNGGQRNWYICLRKNNDKNTERTRSALSCAWGKCGSAGAGSWKADLVSGDETRNRTANRKRNCGNSAGCITAEREKAKKGE